MNTQDRHVISVLVENEPGVIARVAGLFSGRGFNIISFNGAPTNEEGMSRLTITTSGDAQILEQIMKQLNKLVPVVKVAEFSDTPAIERELLYLKVNAEGGTARGEILRTANIFRCKVIDVDSADITLEATGNKDKLEAIISLFQHFGIKELARTGSLVMRRSKRGD